MKNWKAFRLGSPSVALPDILCVNNEESENKVRKNENTLKTK